MCLEGPVSCKSARDYANVPWLGLTAWVLRPEQRGQAGPLPLLADFQSQNKREGLGPGHRGNNYKSEGVENKSSSLHAWSQVSQGVHCMCASLWAEVYLLLTECVRRTAMILDRAMFHSSSVNARVTKPCVACNMWSSTTKNLQREEWFNTSFWEV